MATVGIVQVGVTADTRKLKKNLASGAKDVRRFARDASDATKQGGRGFQQMGQWARKSSETIKTGMGEATRGLAQFTDQAGLAGRAATGVTQSLQGFLQGGLIGLGIGAVTTLFSVIAEESRKAREKAEAEAERAKQKAEEFANRSVDAAKAQSEAVAAIREKSADQAFEHELDLLEQSAAARGEHFDRQLAVELRASKKRQSSNRRMLGDELGAIAELRGAMDEASKENAVKLRQALRLRTENVEALRREIELEASRPDQARGLSSARERARVLAEIRAAKDKEYARDTAAAKSKSDELVTLTRMVEERLRLAQMTDEQRANAADLAAIAKLEAAGRQKHADALRKLLEFERERKRLNEENAAIEARNKAAGGIENQLRKRQELGRATSELERLIARQKAEQVSLLKQGVSQLEIWKTHLVERQALKARERQVQQDFIQGLKDQLEIEKAKTDEKKKQIQRAHELRDIEKKHGAEARKMQEDLNRLRDEGAKKAKSGGGGGGGGGKGILGYGARGEIVYEDGTVDKGLKRRKNLRKAQNKLRKLQRQGAAFGAFGANRGIGFGDGGLKPADSGTLGGMISGRDIPPGTPFSKFGFGPKKKDDDGGGGIRFAKPDEINPPKDTERGGKKKGGKGPGEIERPTTPGTGGAPSDNRVVDGVKNAADAAKRHEETVKKQNEQLKKLEENLDKGVKAAEEGGEQIEAIVESSGELADQSEATADALGTAGPEIGTTFVAAATKLAEVEQTANQVRDDLATVRQILGV